MLKDRLVVGIRDRAMSKRNPELTLEKAKKTVRQREAVQEQQQELQKDESPSAEAVQRGCYSDRCWWNTGGRSSQRKTDLTGKCMRCGKESHPREQCPARDAECHRCKKKGHYGALCKTKTIAGADSMEVAFLDYLTPGKQETVWVNWKANRLHSSWTQVLRSQPSILPPTEA